jgi:DNA polymerase-3 subunit chi
MTEIRFYHLQTKSLEQALPELLTKALAGGRRILVRCPDKSAAEALNEQLWTFRADAFLPHGTAKDGFADRQPVYLSDPDSDKEGGNPNGADVLIFAGGGDDSDIADFTLCCDVFNGSDETALATARARWKNWSAAGHEVTYWQQTEKGWEKKA